LFDSFAISILCHFSLYAPLLAFVFLNFASSFYSDFFSAFSVPALRNPICLAVMLSSNPSRWLDIMARASYLTSFLINLGDVFANP
jgi:hypothetical protein